MSEWIDLNLPYSVHEYFNDAELKYPNLGKRAKKELGYTNKDLSVEFDRLPDHNSIEGVKMDAIIDKIRDKISSIYEQGAPDWRVAYVAKLLKSKNEYVQACDRYTQRYYRYQDWEAAQPDVMRNSAGDPRL